MSDISLMDKLHLLIFRYSLIIFQSVPATQRAAAVRQAAAATAVEVAAPHRHHPRRQVRSSIRCWFLCTASRTSGTAAIPTMAPCWPAMDKYWWSP